MEGGIDMAFLALLHGIICKCDCAEPLCKRVLLFLEAVFSQDLPEFSMQLNILALLFQNQGNYEDVGLYCQRARAIYMNSFGPDVLDVVRTGNNLPSAYL